MSGFKLSGPNVIRSPASISAFDFARAVVSSVSPTLYQIRGFRAFAGAMVSVNKFNIISASVGDMKDAVGTLSAFQDAARSTARFNMRADGVARALAGAKAHATVAGQIGFDLVRTRVAVSQAEEAVRRFKSTSAESALVFMRPELQRLQAAFDGERVYQHQYSRIAAALQSEAAGARASRVGELALTVEKIASQSSIGRGILSTGKILTNPWIGRSLMVVGVGIASIKGMSEAPTKSEEWKIGYGAYAGFSAGVSDIGLAAAVAGRGANPAALLFDPAVKFGSRAAGFGEVGDKFTIGNFFEEGSKAVVSLTQGIVTGDTEAMDAFHKRSMAGHGNRILQGYSMIGESLSRVALVDAAITRIAEINVPAEFRTAPSWWEAVKSDSYSVFEAAKGAAITIKEAIVD